MISTLKVLVELSKSRNAENGLLESKFHNYWWLGFKTRGGPYSAFVDFSLKKFWKESNWF